MDKRYSMMFVYEKDFSLCIDNLNKEDMEKCKKLITEKAVIECDDQLINTEWAKFVRIYETPLGNRLDEIEKRLNKKGKQ